MCSLINVIKKHCVFYVYPSPDQMSHLKGILSPQRSEQAMILNSDIIEVIVSGAFGLRDQVTVI